MPLVPFPDSSPPPEPARRPDAGAALGMLWIRPLGFAAFQALIAGVLALRGVEAPFAASAAYWPVTATLTNLLCIGLLGLLMGRDGTRLGDLLRVDQRHSGKDVPAFFLVLLLAGVVGTVPNVALATWLYGDPLAPMELFLQPLPLWAAVGSLVLFPITIAMSELPLYYGYVMPRLAQATGRGWSVVPAVALVHALQHAALPLIVDPAFALWRGLMFLPLGLLLGGAIFQRPRLLPYLVVVHGLMDLYLMVLVLQASL